MGDSRSEYPDPDEAQVLQASQNFGVVIPHETVEYSGRMAGQSGFERLEYWDCATCVSASVRIPLRSFILRRNAERDWCCKQVLD